MKLHVMTSAGELHGFRRAVTRLGGAGVSGVVITEAGRTAYLACAAAALADEPVDIATGIALAFTRSPMVTATVAWELAQASRGRFRLGLGTQVKAHVERRYGAAYEPPGPRLREHVLAVRAAYRAFRGEERLSFHGDYYDLSLLPREWSPGPIDIPDPPLDVAAVNPWMLRMAGEVADGVHLHPLVTAPYLHETVVPNVSKGISASGRTAPRALFVPVFLAVDDDPAEVERLRERVRRQVAFYGSTPNYAFIFEQLGRPGTTAALQDAHRSRGAIPVESVVDDDLLDHFAVACRWDALPGRLRDRFSGLEEFNVNLVAYLPGSGLVELTDTTLARLGETARALAAGGA